MDQDSAASQAQRKIELQSPQDLAYLVAKVRGAAAARINEAFPHVPGQGEDELRNQIESLVNEVLYSPLPPPPPPSSSTSKSSNSPKAVHRQDLHPRRAEPVHQRPPRLLDRVPLAIARHARHPRALRRPQAPARRGAHFPRGKASRGSGGAEALRAPGKAADEQAARVRDAIRRDEEMVEARTAAVAVEAGKEGGSLRVDRLERQDGVEAGFRGAVEALGRLKRDMPSAVAKMERARVAGEYVLDAK
ncbi:putative kinetochore protein mis14 [Metarhizium anisopliae]|nr:putative kinetochore protein mis14 [Metarhizium anisopliae]